MLKKKDNDTYKKALSSIFTEDQIKCLVKKNRNVKEWSHETIKRALQLKFVCGVNGYEELIRKGMPFPSVRTLRRRLESFKFKPGISNEMLEFLKYKKSYFKLDIDLECGLIFDEMAITPKKCYDSSSGSVIGDITFPNEEGNATHALVFMLVGIASRWKHVVGYHFTGNSFNSKTLKDIVFQIISKTEDIGFHINFITSDMGPGNVGFWKLLGISTGRFSKVKNYIIHPVDPNRHLYIIADPPHVFKNLKQALITNEVITVPNNLVLKYNLPTNKIELKHFYELINVQEESELVLTPKLQKNDIDCNNNFNKMRVSKATHVFSNEVSSSLKLLADCYNKPEFLTTTWFVNIVRKWFSLMTSRSCVLALGIKDNDAYNENINFLYEIVNIFTQLEIGKKGSFKPVQRGIVISTTSIINLTEYLINERSFQFIFTSRFTQDCVENLFSQVRRKNVIPDPLQFVHNLKLIAVAMYMMQVNNSNYQNDDQEYLTGFLEYLSEKKSNTRRNIQIKDFSNINTVPDYKNCTIKLRILDMNSLYNIAGYIINSIIKTCKICKSCIRSAASKTVLQYAYSKFVQYKSYTTNSLYYVNMKTFHIFVKLEKIFRHYSKYFSQMKNVDLKSFLIQKCQGINAEHILPCHDLYSKIMKRFIVFRLKIFNKKKCNNLCKIYDSKSMAMHSVFQ